MLTISVALCTYNGAKFVREQLASIAAQSLQPHELIVCDDGSVDRTPELIETFARTSPFPVRLTVNKSTLGFADNFAQAIGLCHGNVIVLCDQDDVWYDCKLARLEDALRTHPSVGLMFSNADVVDARLRSLGFDLWESHRFAKREQQMVANGAALGVFLRLPVLMGASMAFRTTYRDLILPFPAGTGWGHDQWIGTLISAVDTVCCLNERLFQYRQHSANQFGAYGRSTIAHRVSLPVDERARIEGYAQSAQRYREVLERLRVCADRWSTPDESIQTIQGKIIHMQARASMPRARVQRVPRVLHELGCLRYHRYSAGVWSATRDLVQ